VVETGSQEAWGEERIVKEVLGVLEASSCPALRVLEVCGWTQ
jgi:hypothetical protein